MHMRPQLNSTLTSSLVSICVNTYFGHWESENKSSRLRQGTGKNQLKKYKNIKDTNEELAFIRIYLKAHTRDTRTHTHTRTDTHTHARTHRHTHTSETLNLVTNPSENHSKEHCTTTTTTSSTTTTTPAAATTTTTTSTTTTTTTSTTTSTTTTTTPAAATTTTATTTTTTAQVSQMWGKVAGGAAIPRCTSAIRKWRHHYWKMLNLQCFGPSQNRILLASCGLSPFWSCSFGCGHAAHAAWKSQKRGTSLGRWKPQHGFDGLCDVFKHFCFQTLHTLFDCFHAFSNKSHPNMKELSGQGDGNCDGSQTWQDVRHGGEHGPADLKVLKAMPDTAL